MKRTTLKQQHINGLEYEINYFETELAKNPEYIWNHGKQLRKPEVREILHDLKEELQTINNNKNYKPWKD